MLNWASGLEIPGPGDAVAALQALQACATGFLTAALKWFLVLFLAQLLLLRILSVVFPVSIGSIGYLSLHRITVSVRPGLSISVRKFGVSLHFPSVSRPGWFSFYIVHPRIDLDARIVTPKSGKSSGNSPPDAEALLRWLEQFRTASDHELSFLDLRDFPRWHFCMKIILFLRLRYFAASIYNLTVSYAGLGHVVVGEIHYSINLQSRLSSLDSISGTLHSFVAHPSVTRPVVQSIVCREVVAHLSSVATEKCVGDFRGDFFRKVSRELREDPETYSIDDYARLCDSFSVESKFFYDHSRQAIFDASVEILVGRLTLPMDQLAAVLAVLAASHAVSEVSAAATTNSSTNSNSATSLAPPKWLKAVANAIQLVREFEFKLGALAVFKVAPNSRCQAAGVCFSVVGKDLLLQLRRLNPNNPAFKLLFAPHEYAHQTLFVANSVHVGIHRGAEIDELLYVPVMTYVSKTNTFFRTVRILLDEMQQAASGRSDSEFGEFGTTKDGNENSNLHKDVINTNSGKRNHKTNQNSVIGSLDILYPSFDLTDKHFDFVFRLLACLGSSGEPTSPRGRGAELGSGKLLRRLQKFIPMLDFRVSITAPACRLSLIPKSGAADSCGSATDSVNPVDPVDPAMIVLEADSVSARLGGGHRSGPQRAVYRAEASVGVQGLESWFRPADGSRIDIVATQSVSAAVQGGLEDGVASVAASAELDGLHVELRHPLVVEAFLVVLLETRKAQVAQQGTAKPHSKHSQPHFTSSATRKPPFLARLPPWITEIGFKLHDVSVAAAIAVPLTPDASEADKATASRPRGVRFALANATAEYTHRKGSGGLAGSERKFRVAAAEFTGVKLQEATDPAVFGSDRFLRLPRAEFSMRHTAAGCDTFVSLPVVEAFYTLNLHFLLAALTMLGRQNAEPTEAAEPMGSTEFAESAESAEPAEAAAKPHSQLTQPQLQPQAQPPNGSSFTLKLEALVLKAILPNNLHLIFDVCDLAVRQRPGSPARVAARHVHMYTLSPLVSNAWVKIVSARGLRVSREVVALEAEAETEAQSEAGKSDNPANAEFTVAPSVAEDGWDGIGANISGPKQPKQPKQPNSASEITARMDALVMALPFQFPFYRVFDNFITMGKTIKHIHRAVRHGGPLPVAEPEEETPKIPPRTRIKTRRFGLCIHDDAFETELGIIFQTGLNEQLDRNAKRDLFERKARTLVANFQKHKPRSGLSGSAAGIPHSASVSVPHSAPILSATATATGTAASATPHLPPFSAPHSATTSSAIPTITTSQHGHGIGGPPRARKPPVASPLGLQDIVATIADARHRMHEGFSRSWIKRIRAARRYAAKQARHSVRGFFGTESSPSFVLAGSERIVAEPAAFPLFSWIMDGFDLLLDGPRFRKEQLALYLHETGQMPRDARFTLCFPMYVQLLCGDVRVLLRDYPLPLVHFPAACSGFGTRFSLDLVIAEQFRPDPRVVRRVYVPLVPLDTFVDQEKAAEAEPSLFVLGIPRTVSPVQLFIRLSVLCRSEQPTRITWAPSVEPAMQAAMLCFDNFTKPPLDPSPKPGFWDKMRLLLHGPICVKWRSGDVHLLLKGSKSPYRLIGNGAGFAMVWRSSVALNVNRFQDPTRFMVVDSGEYFFTIPILDAEVAQLWAVGPRAIRAAPMQQKVVMKLSDAVRWQLGLLFQRDEHSEPQIGSRPTGNVPRTLQLRPHHTVELVNGKFVTDTSAHDSYAGFRSQYIHMAISVFSKGDAENSGPAGSGCAEFSTPESEFPGLPRTTAFPPASAFPSASVSSSASASGSAYNSMHLSPRTFAHFFSWWHNFSGVSVPIRHGRLFQTNPVSVKFSRHLFTVKYQLVLQPLFLSHMYRHSASEELTRNNWLAATGLKAKIGSFTMDLHQRRQPVEQRNSVLNRQRTVWRMKMNRAEVDFAAAELRVVSALFDELSAHEFLARAAESDTSSVESSVRTAPLVSGQSCFFAPELAQKGEWMDLDDLVELYDPLQTDTRPKVEMFPLLYTPKLTYFRDTDANSEAGAKTGPTASASAYIPFGSEPSHECLIGRVNPEKTEADLAFARGAEIDAELRENEALLDSLIRAAEKFPSDAELNSRIASAMRTSEILQQQLQIVHAVSAEIRERLGRESLRRAESRGTDNTDWDPLAAPPGPVVGDVAKPQSIPDPVSASVSPSRSRPSSESDAEPRVFAGVSASASISAPVSAPVSVSTSASTSASASASASASPWGPSWRPPARPTMSAHSSFLSMRKAVDPSSARGFVNRFVVHNVALRWNNRVRNLIYLYFHKVSHRRALAFFLSRKAVRMVEDLARQSAAERDGSEDGGKRKSGAEESGRETTSILEEADATDVCSACSARSDSRRVGHLRSSQQRMDDFETDLRAVEPLEAFRETHIVRFIAPQIQLVSDENPAWAALISSHNLEAKFIDVFRVDSEDTDASIVETRYGGVFRGLHVFVFGKDTMSPELLPLLRSSRPEDDLWPPWLSPELCYDSSPLSKHLVIEKTSACLRYDKPNALYVERVTSGTESRGSGGAGGADSSASASTSGSSSSAASASAAASAPADEFLNCSSQTVRNSTRSYRVSLDFPKLIASCTSDQYYTLFTIATDLLMYSEPQRKQTQDQLEKVFLATDFRDLSGVSDRIESLQKEFDLLAHIKQFLLRDGTLHPTDKHPFAMLNAEMERCQIELFLMLQALKKHAQRNVGHDVDVVNGLKWVVGADEIIWHLFLDAGTPFLDFALARFSFNRIEKATGANSNTIEIGMIQGVNLTKNTLYPELLSPYKYDEHTAGPDNKLITVKWTMLEPVGGIPIMARFVAELKPLKLQIEYDTGKKIMEYVFPPQGERGVGGVDDGSGGGNGNGNGNGDGDGDGADASESTFSFASFASFDDSASQFSSATGLSPQASTVSHVGSFGVPGRGSMGGGSHRSVLARLNDDGGSLRPLKSRNKSTKDSRHGKGRKSRNDPAESGDNMSRMMVRASKYFSIIEIRIQSVVLCVSFKGSGARNIADVQNLEFRLPALEYYNTTLSKRDLAEKIQKDVLKAVLAHAGRIIKNKLKRHSKTRYSEPLHQFTSYSQFTPLQELREMSRAEAEGGRRASRFRSLLGVDDTGDNEKETDKGETLASSVASSIKRRVTSTAETVRKARVSRESVAAAHVPMVSIAEPDSEVSSDSEDSEGHREHGEHSEDSDD